MYNIYLITNLENNKKYVGLTKFSITERFHQHLKRGFVLTEAIKKYGENKFFIELIEEVDPSLIGGFVLTVGDEQHDTSISRKITMLKREYNINLYVKDY